MRTTTICALTLGLYSALAYVAWFAA
jgi:hypothetical protein